MTLADMFAYVCKEPQEPQEPDKTDFEDKDAQFDVQMQPQGCDSKTFSHEFAVETGRQQYTKTIQIVLV